jgi:hypothetical protein
MIKMNRFSGIIFNRIEADENKYKDDKILTGI